MKVNPCYAKKGGKHIRSEVRFRLMEEVYTNFKYISMLLERLVNIQCKFVNLEALS